MQHKWPGQLAAYCFMYLCGSCLLVIMFSYSREKNSFVVTADVTGLNDLMQVIKPSDLKPETETDLHTEIFFFPFMIS